MLFRMIYDEKLAQASYLIGCQRTGEAIVVDPQRDADRYIDLASREGLRIVGATETHIHADFLSGVRELAEQAGAHVYLSGEGGPDWRSRWLDSPSRGGRYAHTLLHDGDEFEIGGVVFTAMHTPGHTPEHMCFGVTDRGSGADRMMGVLTGDFLFVGDLGRPDLLETAAGQAGAKEPAAEQLHASVGRLAGLDDYLQVWPGHGAGSACGKALGAVPASTIGYERRFNPAVGAASDRRAFVEFILSGQPEPPLYFARMKRQNRDGVPLLGCPPAPPRLRPDALRDLDTRRVALIDTRTWDEFRAGHVPGSLYHPLNRSFTTDVGSMVGEDEDIVLIVPGRSMDEALRDLRRIGLDRAVGWLEPGDLESYRAGGGALVGTEQVGVEDLDAETGARSALLLDVRRASEFEQGHLPGAINISHTRLRAHLDELPRDRRIVVNCRSGGRSARACALLQRNGFEPVNLAGGYLAWAGAHEAAGAG